MLLLSTTLSAQQPFLTDDADVTAPGRFHLEVINQFSWLQQSAYPNLRQNAGVFHLNYGVRKGLEIGVDSPILSIFNDPMGGRKDAFGIGDTNFTAKWNFRTEQEKSKWPALTITGAVETPTGDARRQLGSGLADAGLTFVVQKTLRPQTVLRLNSGLLFSGNTLTGVVGLNATGFVFTGAASLTHQISDSLLLGIEIYGAEAPNSGLGKGALQTQIGGKYVLGKGLTLDFGAQTGRFAGSPRIGLQAGFSKDF